MKFRSAFFMTALSFCSTAFAGDEVAIDYIHVSSTDTTTDLKVGVTNLTGSDISSVTLRAASDSNISLSFPQIKLGETAYADLRLVRDLASEPEPYYWDVDYVTSGAGRVSETIE